MRSFFLMCVAAAVLAPQACVGDDPSVGPGGNEVDAGDGDEGRRDGSVITSPDAGNSSRVSLSVPAFSVVRDVPTPVTVTLSWVGAASPLKLEWAGLPPGADGGSPVIVGTGTFEQRMTLSVPSTVAFGELKVQLVATSEDPSVGVSSIDVLVDVRGARGTVDPTFGMDGAIELPSAAYGAMGMFVDAQGRMIVTGQSQRTLENYSEKLVLARYTPAGRFDTSFGIGGVTEWQDPFPDHGPTSSPDHHELSTIEAPGGYRVAASYLGVAQSVVGVSQIAEDGSFSISPPVVPATARAYFGTTLPQGSGAIFSPLASCDPVRLDAAGSAIAEWSAAAKVPVRADFSSCSLLLLAASPSQILYYFEGVLSDVTTRGLTVVDRETGAVVGRQPVSVLVDVGAPLAEGGFIALGRDGTGVRIAASGSAAQLSAAPAVPVSARSALVNLKNGRLGLLVTSQPAHSVELHVLDSAGRPDGGATTLQSIDIADRPNTTNRSATYAYQAFEDDQHRLVVFYRARFNQVASSTHANPHWLIRRYWL